MRKRGAQDLANGAVISLILIIVAFMVMSAAFTQFYKLIPEKYTGTSCRASNVVRGQTQIRGSMLGVNIEQSGVPSACKTYTRVLTGTRGAIMRGIADMATDCWWQWANGNFAALLCDEKNYVAPMHTFELGSCHLSHCFQCYSFTFGKIDPGPYKDTRQFITATELREYMSSTLKYVENSNTGKVAKGAEEATTDVSYLDYIQYDERGILAFDLRASAGDTMVLEPNQIYSIAYFEPDYLDDGLSKVFNRLPGFSDGAPLDKVKGKRVMLIGYTEYVENGGYCKLIRGFDGK